MKKILIGSDKSGFRLKESVKMHLMNNGYEIEDAGTLDESNPFPFHVVAKKVAKQVQDKEYDKAILVCGTGMGMSIVANTFEGVHAACVESSYAAEKCRAINDANVMTMGGWIIGDILGCEMVDKFLNTEFTQGLEEWRADFLKKAKEQVLTIEKENYKK